MPLGKITYIGSADFGGVLLEVTLSNVSWTDLKLH